MSEQGVGERSENRMRYVAQSAEQFFTFHKFRIVSHINSESKSDFLSASALTTSTRTYLIFSLVSNESA